MASEVPTKEEVLLPVVVGAKALQVVVVATSAKVVASVNRTMVLNEAIRFLLVG